MTSFCDVTWWRYIVLCCHVMAWHQTIGHNFVLCHSNQKKVRKIAQTSHFLTWWPWPLTYDLDHHTWPWYGPGWHTCQISCPCVKRFCLESADRRTHRQTDRHTDRTDSITSTADAGGNEIDRSWPNQSNWRRCLHGFKNAWAGKGFTMSKLLRILAIG